MTCHIAYNAVHFLLSSCHEYLSMSYPLCVCVPSHVILISFFPTLAQILHLFFQAQSKFVLFYEVLLHSVNKHLQSSSHAYHTLMNEVVPALT